ncbi:hypothetical protein JD508_18810 [Aeromonas jandaei]|uniref:hypothetical protein n=1 Tax=Aeromonas jandaei TaxID=650 RepID=UPI00191E1EE4|nr:hypothetical protein [Aeromonas jandaei]MBL0612280.1 hypothetical protein [Aeromonas jandaei]
MKVNLDVVIKSGDDDVDMDYALETLSGTVSISCLLAEAILRGRVKERRTHADSVRANLKQSFKSSYGQKFELVINDKNLISKLNKIGKSVFSEVMSYYIREALYLEQPSISNEAASVIDSLCDIEVELVGRLMNPLKQMHRISIESDFDIALNYRKPGETYNIACLNQETGMIINAQVEGTSTYEIEAAITRFNSMTGNGRLILKDDNEIRTISFGFKDSLKYVTESYKKRISENLHQNNAKKADNRTYIKLNVYDIKITNGSVVKFLIKDIKQ